MGSSPCTGFVHGLTRPRGRGRVLPGDAQGRTRGVGLVRTGSPREVTCPKAPVEMLAFDPALIFNCDPVEI